MAKNKTTYTNESISNFIDAIESEQKKADSYALMELMSKVTNEDPALYGPTIVGFGKYAYTYASGHSGEAPLVGFSPRKAAFSLYVFAGTPHQEELLKQLGKFTMGKSCIYVKKLSDINIEILTEMMVDTIHYLSTTHKRMPL